MQAQKIVLTVCKGNIHRSVIAAASITKLLEERSLGGSIAVRSRGLQGAFGFAPPRRPSIRDYPEEWALTQPGIESLGIVIPDDQTATPITINDVAEAHLILAMDAMVRDAVLEGFRDEMPLLSEKTMLFMELGGVSEDVPDLDGKRSLKLFDRVTEVIYRTAEANFSTLVRLVSSA